MSKQLSTPPVESSRCALPPQDPPHLGLVKRLFDKTRRSGGGVTKSNVVGIRPDGSTDKLADWIDKSKAEFNRNRPGMLSKPLEVPKGIRPAQHIPEKLKAVLPRSFCPDCNRNDRPVDPVTAGGILNIGVAPVDWPHLRLQRGDIFLSAVCDECVRKFKEDKYKPEYGLLIAKASGIATNKQERDTQRVARMAKNTESFIRSRITAGDDSIWVTRAN